MNDVKFSPDARLVASASFDKSIRVRNDPMDLLFCLNPLFTSFPKVWCGKTGRFLMTLRGHVQAVYQVHLPEQSSIQFLISQKVAWAADSRLLVSGSADSTLKLWSMETKKLHTDLPGHGDEVDASSCFWETTAILIFRCTQWTGVLTGSELSLEAKTDC